MKKKSGSILLVTLIVTTFLSGLVLSCWRQASLFGELVIDRQRYWLALNKAELQLDQALAMLAEQGDAQLPPGVSLTQVNTYEQVLVSVVDDGGKSTAFIRCLVTKQKDGYHVSHYTLSTRT